MRLAGLFELLHLELLSLSLLNPLLRIEGLELVLKAGESGLSELLLSILHLRDIEAHLRIEGHELLHLIVLLIKLLAD